MEYTARFRTRLLLPRGRYDLGHEIGNIAPLQDDCTRFVEGSLRVEAVRRNGRQIDV